MTTTTFIAKGEYSPVIWLLCKSGNIEEDVHLSKFSLCVCVCWGGQQEERSF